MEKKTFKIQKIENSHKIFLSSNIQNSTLFKSKSLNISINFKKILQKIKELGDEKGEHKITINVYDIKNKHSKSIHITIRKPNSKQELEDSMKEIINHLIGTKGVQDPKSNRFRFIIENNQSVKTDKKSWVFNSKKEPEKIMDELKEKIKEIKKNIEHNIVFMNDKELSYTHRISLYKCGSTEAYKEPKLSSFTIKFPNYSSSEIREILGGK